ncbi:MAG: hypothetical protein BMS9Abin13_483 [Patescibacteria group bacterium]|nr:MAG: hypothetical protein BMS9Abin13_483 [Patescibacteria group bacterium]
MPQGDKKNRIEELKKSLYVRGFQESPIARGGFSKKDYGVAGQWKEKPPRPVKKIVKKLPTGEISTFKKVLIASLVFFVGALGFASYSFYKGGNVVSAKNVKISVVGPVSINGGEELNLEILIVNKNDVAIETADLLIEYPSGTYASPDSQEELLRDRETLGIIGANESITRTIAVVLFGEENSEKSISITLEFRFEESNALLEKKEIYTLGIASSPVNLSLDLFKEVSSGQEFEMEVRVESNSNNTLMGMLVEVDYPIGFVFVRATPPPSYGEKIWEIGDLPPSAERVIKITGMIEGQEGGEKLLRIYTGIRSNKDEKIIGTAYNSISESISISKPFLGLDILIDGNRSSEYVSDSEKTIRVDVLWSSNIPTRVVDGEIEVTLSGEVLDRFSVSAGKGGFYRSIDNTLIWTKAGNPDLAVIEPGARGNINFSFKPLSLSGDGRSLKNPEIMVEVRANGRRISDINVPEEIGISVTKRVKIESELTLIPRAVYYTGPFENSGPLSPRPEQETTYTIIWTITNSSNTISSAVVRGALPTYVKWLGVVSPPSEDVSFSEIGGEVTWKVGTLLPGIGITTEAREVAFQISFLPSISQINEVPFLVVDTVLSGEDDFTETLIKSMKSSLTTRLSTDPYFNTNQAVVRE